MTRFDRRWRDSNPSCPIIFLPLGIGSGGLTKNSFALSCPHNTVYFRFQLNLQEIFPAGIARENSKFFPLN